MGTGVNTVNTVNTGPDSDADEPACARLSMRRKGFNFKQVCRTVNPALAAKLYPIPRREGDLRNRLERVEDQIAAVAWGPNSQVHADRMARLIDQKQALRAALGRDKTGSKT